MFSFIFYPTACSPKGYGSGLPLPSRTAAHFPAFKPESCPQLHASHTGATLSPSPHTRQIKGDTRKPEQNKNKNKQPNRQTGLPPRGPPALPSSALGSILSSTSVSPSSPPFGATGVSSSGSFGTVPFRSLRGRGGDFHLRASWRASFLAAQASARGGVCVIDIIPKEGQCMMQSENGEVIVGYLRHF